MSRRRRALAVGQQWTADEVNGNKPNEGERWRFQIIACLQYPSNRWSPERRNYWVAIKLGVEPACDGGFQIWCFDDHGLDMEGLPEWQFRLLRKVETKHGVYVPSGPALRFVEWFNP